MSFEIKSRVVALETGRPLRGLEVQALDADILHDDPLGRGKTDAEGICRITVEMGALRVESPDIYVVVRSADGQVLASVRGGFLRDVGQDISVEVAIPCFRLLEAGVLGSSDLPTDLCSITEAPALRDLTLGPAAREDALVTEIERELEDTGTVLALLKRIMGQAQTTATDQTSAWQKLAKLFEMGREVTALEGHHYGVVLGLRPTAGHPLSSMDNLLGLLWGAALNKQSPWVGKTFRRGDQTAMQAVVGTVNLGPASRFSGLNHFHHVDWHPANSIPFHALTWWLNLQEAALSDQQAFGYERMGAPFVAGPAASVCAQTSRQVFALNYRWPSLRNRPPLSWLVDEMVQISDGLYLGQMLVASRRLMSAYDPRRPTEEYAYQPMGYFVLWNQTWNGEARRLFPFLEIPVTAPGLVGSVSVQGSRYRDLKLDERPPSTCKERVFAEVKTDLAGRETILHLLSDYGKALAESMDSDSPFARRMQELFNRAAPAESMSGYYRGALVGWHSAGLVDLFSRNKANQAWNGFASRFGSWTGLCFEPASPERLKEITEGVEAGDPPCTWGCNTQALRTTKQRELGHLMKLAHSWTEPASSIESIKYGYDLKKFFFIARAGTSVNKDCAGKRTYQLNYRWPKLRTIAPDCYCIDELVQLADGLMLGQLMYATDWQRAFDPRKSAESYRYGMFGYFLLMDESWHQVRLRLGFDLENV